MSIIYFVIILGVIVLVHELGHLITAKMFGVYCKEFAIGMGPRIFSKKGKETVYSIRALPLGGFVSMAGEEGIDTADIPFSRTLKGIAPYKRMIIMLAGIIMNIILAMILFIGLFMYTGSYTEAPPATIYDIVENSPAQEAGFMANDEIVKVEFSDGTIIYPEDFYEILQFSSMYATETIYTINRAGETLEIAVVPQYLEDENRYYVGMTLPQATVVELDIIESITYGVEYTFYMIAQIGEALSRLVQGIGLNQMSGPIGILQVTDDVVSNADSFKDGVINMVNLIALMSVNVGIFNLIPLPLFDGGRVLLTLVEIIIRRPLNEKLEGNLIMISAILVFGLFIFITGQDLFRLFTK